MCIRDRPQKAEHTITGKPGHAIGKNGVDSWNRPRPTKGCTTTANDDDDDEPIAEPHQFSRRNVKIKKISMIVNKYKEVIYTFNLSYYIYLSVQCLLCEINYEDIKMCIRDRLYNYCNLLCYS